MLHPSNLKTISLATNPLYFYPLIFPKSHNKYGLSTATMTGTISRHPSTVQARESCRKLSSVHPSYVIFTAQGKSEIIEHRKMEPIFYVTDEKHVQQYPSKCNAPNHAAQPDAAEPRGWPSSL